MSQRKARAAFNQWGHVWRARARVAAFGKRMSPEGRAMRSAFGSFQQLYYGVFVGRQGDAACRRSALARVVDCWVEATFVAFHILAGVEAVQHFLAR
eukprot:2764689-Prymnesium_polylepis.1